MYFVEKRSTFFFLYKNLKVFKIIKTCCILFKNINDKWFELNKHRCKENIFDRKYIRNKLEYENYQVCKKLIDIALYYKVEIFGLEDLQFKRKKQNKKQKKIHFVRTYGLEISQY